MSVGPIRNKRSKTLPWKVDRPAGYRGATKRETKYFKTKGAAQDECDRVNLWLSAQKTGVTIQNPDAEALRMVGLLQTHGITTFDELNQMIGHWRKTAALRPARMADVVEEFRAWKTTKVGQNTRPELNARLNIISAGLGTERIADIDNVAFEAFLEHVPGGDWNKRHVYKWGKQLMRFAKSRRYILSNPLDEVHRPGVSKGEVEIYSLEDIAKIVDWLKTHDPKLLPTIALQAWNFVRVCELVGVFPNEPVLLWSDFLDNGEFVIRPEVAKQTANVQRRFIPILLNLETGTGTVSPVKDKAYRQRTKKLFKATGVNQLNNGFRHSCLSYFIARHPQTGVATVAKYAGNTEEVIRRSYLKGVPQSEGEAYFRLRPFEN